MSGHVEHEAGFKVHAMVDPQEGTVHSLTTREEGKKRGRLVSTPVRIITEERYGQLASTHNDLIDNARRSAEMMNELAIDYHRHESSMHHNMCDEGPRRDRVHEGSNVEVWNKACDETIVRHHERRKALISYRENELGREKIREDGGISRAILNVIEELEAVLQTRLNRKSSPRIEHISEGEETVITIRIPEDMKKHHVSMDFEKR